ncbi:MAG: SulP family inorganic anion transporter [Rhodoferax sp.]|nr:SulP family inorganic anion transporter [Rhodoferax sp.]
MKQPLLPDIVAGLCVAGLLLPEAVAYAGLAHLPVGHALTAVVMGLAVYALFGGSRFAIVSPTSSTATLAAAAAVSMGGAAVGTAAYTQVVMALVLLSGGMLMLLAAAHQGQLSSYVSRPVLKGFAFALAVSIVIKQLPDALGLELPAGTPSDPLRLLYFTLRHVPLCHLPTLAVALAAGGLMLLLRRWQRIPASLLVMLLAIGLAALPAWQTLGVRQIGVVAAPAFAPALPALPLDDWLRAAELAFGLVMLVFAESWGSMRAQALATGDTLDANRELLVLGACNVGAGLLQGMVVGAGFSVTSANAAAGAVSRKSGVVALIAVLLAIAFALPVLHLLPKPVLAVAVISALWHALSIRPLRKVWQMNRDRWLLLAAVLAVLFLGVLDGMLVAIALSVLGALHRFSQPVVHELGELGSSRNYVDVQVQQGAAAKPGVLILRPEEPLFFGSAERVMSEVLHRAKARDGLHTVVLSLEESADLDSTAVDCLMELRHSLQVAGKRLLLARVKTTVRGLLQRVDPQGVGDDTKLFWSVADAAAVADKPA